MSGLRRRLRFLRWPLAIIAAAIGVLIAVSIAHSVAYVHTSTPHLYRMNALILSGGGIIFDSGPGPSGEYYPDGFQRWGTSGLIVWPVFRNQDSLAAGERELVVSVPLWMPLLLFAAATAWLLWPTPKPNHCSCGYDLAGLPASASVCPECGRALSAKGAAA